MAIVKVVQRSNSSPIARVCPMCSSDFLIRKYDQIYCSAVCGYTAQNRKNPWVSKARLSLACKRCGNDLAHKKPHALYCSKTCKSMDHTFNRRRGTRTQNIARRMEIIVRDGFACYLCGSLVTVKSAEIDHLIPVRFGGETDPSNLATSCAQCNKSKGASMDIRAIVKRNEIRSAA